MDSKAKKYEIAYVLSPSIAEEEVSGYSGKINSAIEDSKGLIKYSESPKKIRLAYPIEKDRNAYFAWTVFNASTDAIKSIDKKVKEIKEVVRFLIVEKDAKEVPLRPIRVPSFKTPAEVSTIKTETPSEGEDKLDLEALDKKLEEILGK